MSPTESNKQLTTFSQFDKSITTGYMSIKNKQYIGPSKNYIKVYKTIKVNKSLKLAAEIVWTKH